MPRPTEPKLPKHHYIPVFYLKQWAGADGRVCEYSKPYDRVKPRRSHPDGTGYERGLYAIEDIDPTVVNAIEEMFLKPSDGMASLALQSMLREEPFPKPVQMRHAWTRFVLSLMIRYPEAITVMKQRLRANIERAYLGNKKPEDPPTFAEYEALQGTRELARLHGKLMMDLMLDSRMGRILFEMHWGIVKFGRIKHELLTSDRPITSNAFPISANHVCLPISPTVIFFACQTDRAERESRRLDPRDIMQTLNERTVRRAQAYVWGKDDLQLRFVENRFGKSDSAALFGAGTL